KMAVSNAGLLKDIHSKNGALPPNSNVADFTAVIKGFENHKLLIRQIPWPVLATGEAMEVPGPMGVVFWQPTQAKTNQQGAFVLMETVNGMVDNMLIALLLQGGTFDMIAYEGTDEVFTRAKRYHKCSLSAEPVDRDWESRQQPMQINGTLFYHYYGDDIDGNTERLSG
ncbi:MAG: hypothetical protein ACPGGD_10790, partial [Thalassolituus sp.]